jgi:hypothetical protein
VYHHYQGLPVLAHLQAMDQAVALGLDQTRANLLGWDFVDVLYHWIDYVCFGVGLLYINFSDEFKILYLKERSKKKIIYIV